MGKARFSALQRAEIAEMVVPLQRLLEHVFVSVLFNEPKLLKFFDAKGAFIGMESFSALQRAEIAEIVQIAL